MNPNTLTTIDDRIAAFEARAQRLHDTLDDDCSLSRTLRYGELVAALTAADMLRTIRKEVAEGGGPDATG